LLLLLMLCLATLVILVMCYAPASGINAAAAVRKGIRCAYKKSGEASGFLHSQNVHGFFCHHVCR
jgi:hypothetical protein